MLGNTKTKVCGIEHIETYLTYRKVVSSRLSRLVAHLVDWSTACNFTVAYLGLSAHFPISCLLSQLMRMIVGDKTDFVM